MKRAGGLTFTASVAGFIFFLLRRVETWLPAAKVTLPLAIVSIATAATVATHQLTETGAEPVLLLSSFKSASLEEGLLNRTGVSIISKLNALPGDLRIAARGDATQTGTLPLVVGSMEQAGQSIYLTVKVIDPVTSKILFIGEASAPDKEGLDAATEDLAKKLHGFAASLSKK